MPLLRRLRLDDAGDRAVQQQREQKGRRDRLVRRAPAHRYCAAPAAAVSRPGCPGARPRSASTVGSSAASSPRRAAPRKLRAPCPVRNSFSVSSNRRAGGTPPSSSASARSAPPSPASSEKPELRLEARGAQHAHRILAIARLRIADQPQRARGDVCRTAHVVPDREIGDVVVERVGGEVAAPDVLVDGAVDVVAQDAPGLIESARCQCRVGADRMDHVGEPERRTGSGSASTTGSSRSPTLHPEFRQLVVVQIGDRAPRPCERRAGRAERRDFDDLAAEEHMRETEPPADQTAVAEQLAHLLRQRVGGDVEIFRL